MIGLIRLPDPLEPLRAEPSSLGPSWPLWLIFGAIMVAGALQIAAVVYVIVAALLGFLR